MYDKTHYNKKNKCVQKMMISYNLHFLMQAIIISHLGF